MDRIEATETLKITATFKNGDVLVTGLTPALSIQRQSDGGWWDEGLGLWLFGYGTEAMTELTGNDGVEGKYEYDLGTPGVDVYRFRVREVIGGALQVKEGVVQVFEPDLVKIGGNAVRVIRMAEALDVMPKYTASGTPTATSMESDAVEANGIFDTRTIIWTTGNAAKQQADISTYLNTNGTFTFPAVAVVPSAGDEFIIV